MELYQDMIAHILFLSPMRRNNQALILPNRRESIIALAVWHFRRPADCVCGSQQHGQRRYPE